MKFRLASALMAAVLLLTAILPVSVLATYENTYKNTGDQRADIIGVALTQVGYIEEKGGYTKYGAWFGRPYEDWCGIFVSWCAEQAGIPTSVLRKNGMATPSGFGFSTYYSSSQYTPKPGDLFFTKSFSHAGIVYYVEGDSFYTLEGNTWHNGSPHGVMTKKRALNEHYYVSPNYNGSGSSITPPTPTVPACSHSWKDNGIIKEPGCTTSGSKSQVCEKCGVKRTASIKETGHSFGDWTEKDEKQHKRTCKNCDKTETKNHDEMTWQNDSAGHWKECETCKGQFEIDAHTYAGGCGTKCRVCDYASQDGHNYGSWQTDDTGHWQVCIACEKETEKISHSYASQCAEICADCGYQRVTTHTFLLQADKKGHWQACTVCGKEEIKEAHVPGAEATEETAQLCTHCGYEIAPKLPHTHLYTYSFDRMSHQGICACGDRIEENHSWSMDQSGCSVCGAEGEKTEEKTDWDIVWIGAGAALIVMTSLSIILLLVKKKKKD